MNQKIRNAGFAVLVVLWILLTVAAWFVPAKDISTSERRPLAQMPELSWKDVIGGRFTSKVEEAATDQFPLRDTFRSMKALFSKYVLNQKDNNGIYVAEGYIAKQEYPLNQSSVDYALNKFNYLYETYFKDSNVVMAVVPDKGYYLAEQNGYLAMDYESLFDQIRQGMPWAQHVDLTQALSISDYYRTDTHWKQENLLPAAKLLTEALGAAAPKREVYTPTVLDMPFYGVYYGQAALPMDPEEITLMNSQLLQGCRVYNHETGKYTQVYDLEKKTSQDLYDIYLSGAQALLTIENPAGQEGKELIVFRDSFGSSMVPLLVEDYAKVTLVDLRYIKAELLGNYLAFHGQDVLMLYSTLILNSSMSLK